MCKYIKRLLNIDKNYSSFLWGAGKTGKSFWIRHNFSPEEIILIDLLKTDTFVEYASRPSLLRERYQNTKKIIAIDEIQKAPILLVYPHMPRERITAHKTRLIIETAIASC